jgi:hypothetical protein
MIQYRLLAAAALIATTTVLVGCQSAVETYPYRYTALYDETDQARTVMVLTLEAMLPNVKPPAHDQARLLEVGMAQLRDAGFTVRDSGPLLDAWDRRLERHPGFFDPHSGAFRLAAWQETLGQAMADLPQDRRVDGIVMLGVLRRQVETDGYGASWDGVTRKVRTVNAPPNEELHRVTGAMVGASLLVWVFDRDGHEVLQNVHGVDLITYFHYERADQVTVREVDDPLGDQEELEEAFSASLAPLRAFSPDGA